MQIYLPIAELSVNAFMLLGLGGLGGFLSGMFGVGGGFLTTPLLLFIGVPPAVAVATIANQLLANSVSGALAQWWRGAVDLRMGMVLVAGGLIGSALGVQLLAVLRRLGQVDLVISLAYVAFLGILGSLMLAEASRALLKQRGGKTLSRRRRHTWIHRLPFKVRFRKSKLYISMLAPLMIGAVGGMLVAIMGFGSGFIMVPAMIYLLGMPTSIVVGTSLFQIIFVTATVTFLQSVTNQSVDIMLAVFMMAGGVIGAQFGSRVGSYLRGEHLRVLLAIIVLIVAGRMAWDLVVTPADLFEVSRVYGHGGP